MAVSPQSATPFAFGPFEVDANAPALLKNGVRIRLAGQPLKILLVLLARPGELIIREQLRQEVWGGETFVDFEHGLNAAVNKLRSALNDSAENPRYIETVPGRGYRFIGALEAQLSRPGPSAEASSIREQPASGRPTLHWWWLAAIAACAGISFVAGRRVPDVRETLPPWTLTRITADAGISDAPAISPDGRLVAYSSNSGPEGERDLYVKQSAGGQPVRLTSDGAGNTTPDFSPDGTRIVFRSDRDGGGIYEVPALGGEARLLAREGLDPRYSPDGSRVAYWVGAPGVAPAVPGGGSVWVAPRAGGQPQRVGPGFTNARYPIWSPDGKHLLFRGYTSAKAYDGSSIDWWYVSVDGRSSVKTGAYEALIRTGLLTRDTVGTPVGAFRIDASPRPGCWLAATNSVVFSAPDGDTQNLWETGISSTGKANGVLKRLTSGAGNEQEPSCALGNAFAFTNAEVVRNVWSVPFDLNGGRPKGAFDRVTEGPARRENPSLSRDGRYVAFASSQSGSLNIWRRELATGEETHVGGSSLTRRYPAMNASGTKVAFSSYESGKRILYVSTPGGLPERLCEGCLRATDWSRDDESLLVFGGSPYKISVLDLASHRQTPILKHSTDNLLYARYSPDNRWVSFTGRLEQNRTRITIAPLDGEKPVPENEWIAITEEGAEDWADWLPDGKTLYFTSARDGRTCLWGQRLDPDTHRPAGPAFAALHLHGRATYRQGGWSTAGGRIAIVLEEDKGNIWMMSRSATR